jgi:protocatechuate 3,4-dioxygenase beta subunit
LPFEALVGGSGGAFGSGSVSATSNTNIMGPIGWYPGRTPHIHFKVFVGERNLVTGQIYFPDPVTEHVYATSSPYRERKAERDTFNSDDVIFARQGGADTVVSLNQEGGSFLAKFVIGIKRNA